MSPFKRRSLFRSRKPAAQLHSQIGKAGLSDGFIRTVSEELARHELVKIKFVEFKEEKKTLAPLLAEKARGAEDHLKEVLARRGRDAVDQ